MRAWRRGHANDENVCRQLPDVEGNSDGSSTYLSCGTRPLTRVTHLDRADGGVCEPVFYFYLNLSKGLVTVTCSSPDQTRAVILATKITEDQYGLLEQRAGCCSLCTLILLVASGFPVSDLDRAFWISPGYRVGGGELGAGGIVKKSQSASIALRALSQNRMHAESGIGLVQEKMQNIKRP